MVDEAWLSHYLHSVWPSTLSAEARSNLLALYRGLAEPNEGRPLMFPHREIPSAWLERNADGELVGVGGLSRVPTPHALELGRRTLYAWCAFDCMFLPEILGATLKIRSACPASGKEIKLRVSAETVEDASPRSMVMSFVTPDADAVEAGLRQVFCRHVRFFESAQAAASNLSESVVLLNPGVAHRLGAIRNRIVFGGTLASDRP